MKNPRHYTYMAIGLFFLISTISLTTLAQGGKIAQRVNSFKKDGSFTKESNLFRVGLIDNKQRVEIYKQVKQFAKLDINGITDIVKQQPAFLNFTIPSGDGQTFRILLYKESISSNGFNLLTSDGNKYTLNENVHYKGSIDGDPRSVVAFSFSENEISGLICNERGNYVMGKMNDHSGDYIIYNDKNSIMPMQFDCGTNTAIPLAKGNYLRSSDPVANLTTKCVNWYWETDYDLYVSKGSVANVTTYVQNVFNQVQTLYANDGVSITLKTLYVWSTVDPYTGTTTSNYLDQFGVNRTSFDGDLATLLGTGGGGGIAWINGLCNSQAKYKMAYCGINNSYATVPTYSWTVEVVTHEQGHLLGSRHTHDCVWNGNNTKIDGCGDNAGYTSGTCANPGNPVGGGTIMSYCHLTSVGINFNLGFGPQPQTLIVNNVNNAACLTNCSSGCTTPDQPAAISGSASVCSGTSQTYSVAAVSGATSYNWSLPSGWTGSSTTNSITVTTGTTSGNISVTAANTCGAGTARTLAVTVSSAPAQPGTITGNATVCPTTAQTYSVTAVSGATSYTWTLPSGWTGSSTTNSINATAGTAGGTISVKANNTCGSGTTRTLTVSISTAAPAQPGAISGSASICAGTSQTYSVAAVSGASSYSWTLPSGWTGSSTTNTITVTAGSSGGTISVAAVNGCGTSTARTLAVTIGSGTAPARPGTITVSGGTARVCPGDSRTYTVTAISGLTYTWVAPAGANITSGQGTASINVTYTPNFTANGVLSVTASNGCGTSPARNLTIARNTPSAPAAITGQTTICTGTIGTYTATAVSTASSYLWTVPSGGTIQGASNTNVINILWGTTGGTLAVKAVNACGNSGSRSVKITISCTGGMAGTIDNTSNNRTTIYPNPANNIANLSYFAKEKADYNFMITDLSGKTVIKEHQQANTGMNLHSFDVSKLAKGTYLVVISNNKSKETIKLNVQ